MHSISLRVTSLSRVVIWLWKFLARVNYIYKDIYLHISICIKFTPNIFKHLKKYAGFTHGTQVTVKPTQIPKQGRSFSWKSRIISFKAMPTVTTTKQTLTCPCKCEVSHWSTPLKGCHCRNAQCPAFCWWDCDLWYVSPMTCLLTLTWTFFPCEQLETCLPLPLENFKSKIHFELQNKQTFLTWKMKVNSFKIDYPKQNWLKE